jgi:site-specific DNA-cytosine methylase
MGWEAAFFSEIEKFPCAVLQHRYPDVPLHGDFTTIKENEYGKIDLLVGGTPCQSFSVAGLRGGLDDDRGNLALEFCRLAQREQPRWIVWENVPGVLSSSGGRDFGSILGALEDLGYGLAYRVLDAQYFGVAQRRRRVFVVGYLGDWRPAAAVLFERHSMSGHSAPSREKREEATDAAATGTGDSGGNGGARSDLDTFECGGIGSYSASDNSSPLLRTGADLGPGCEALIASTFNDDGTARTLTARYDSSPCVDRGPDIVAVNINGGEPRLSDVVGTLDCWSTSGRGSSQQLAVLQDAPDVVGTLRAKRPGEGGIQGDFDHIVPVVSPALNTQSGSHHAPDTKAYVAFTARDYGADATEDLAPTMRSLAQGADGHQSGSHGLAVAYGFNGDQSAKTRSMGETIEQSPTLRSAKVAQVAVIAQPVAFSSNMSVPDCQTDGTTPTLKLGGHGGGNPPAVAFDTTQITSPHNYSNPQPGDPCHPLAAGAHPPAVAFDHPGRFNNIHGGSGEHQDVMPTLEATNPKQIIAHTEPAIGWSEELTASVDLAGTLQRGGSGGRHDGVMEPTSTVRRLTPVECERLQGFPDNFTAIPWRKKDADDCPDGPRYKALGNSMAVPVMRWIGERINLIDDYLSII